MREKLSLNTVAKTNKTRKRIGRGPGSGSGKTSGRGHKGLGSRSGGKVRVTIPAGTQSGHRFRLKGKGMPVVNRSNKGDLYVDVYTEIPVSLNKQQRKVLEELRNLEENSNHPDSTNFTNKVNKTRQ